jgi:hypothetical protein
MFASIFRMLVLALALLAWVGIPVSFSLDSSLQSAASLCPSGSAQARLTGWILNSKMPVGTANYNESTKQLDIAVESVALADGTTLLVFEGDNRLGQLKPLKDGSASGTVTATVPDAARLRILNGETPIVSANLKCVDSTPTPTQTPSPSPSPSPAPTVTPSPSPTATVAPSPSPAPSPLPTTQPLPAPSPSPAL